MRRAWRWARHGCRVRIQVRTLRDGMTFCDFSQRIFDSCYQVRLPEWQTERKGEQITPISYHSWHFMEIEHTYPLPLNPNEISPRNQRRTRHARAQGWRKIWEGTQKNYVTRIRGWREILNGYYRSCGLTDNDGMYSRRTRWPPRPFSLSNIVCQIKNRMQYAW